MKFEKIQGSQIAAGPIKDLIDELIALLEKDEDFIIDNKEGNQVRAKGCKDGNNCLLEFFYYYDPTLKHIPAYKNGVWIRINGNNSVWLYVHNKLSSAKKASVFSEEKLSCTPNTQVKRSYFLPFDFTTTPAWYENHRVTSLKKQNPDFLLNEIKKRLCCVCSV